MSRAEIIAFCGLGRMGFNMAKNLLNDGFSVIGTTRVPEKREEFTRLGGKIVENAAEAAKLAKIIVLLLPSETAFHSVLDELDNACEPGSIVVEMDTFPISEKEMLRDRLEPKGVRVIDAPISGTVPHVINRSLSVFASGDQEAWEYVRPFIEPLCSKIFYVGEYGNGMKMKLIANQLVTINNVATAEAVLFSVKMGMDPKAMLEAITQSSALTPLSVRGPIMAARSWEKPTMTHNVYWKDINIIRDALHKYGSPSPLFNATIPIYSSAIACGHGEHDTASVYTVLENMVETVSE